jgi:Spy/CpxP family protein refolding chaperone
MRRTTPVRAFSNGKTRWSVTTRKHRRQIVHMNLKTISLLFLGAIAAGPLQAQSQTPEATPAASPGWHEHHHWRHHHAWFWKKLNLTEAQRASLKQLRQNNEATLRPALLLVLQDRQALQQAIASNVPANITAAANKLGTDQGALIAARVTLRNQMINYIMTNGTTEQKNLLSEWQQKNATRLQDKINRLSSNSNS